MDVDLMADDTEAMARMMGFGGFTTTHGKQVDGNEVGTANVKKQRTWRQYMNRKGGFNRSSLSHILPVECTDLTISLLSQAFGQNRLERCT
ncbi:DUF1777-domain-containing protein [Atractiella rhizophila]|nr:DUF1777-domain-containing protein [Atractiella rhizophila]KAH8922805.1 DUF1777-domain-containing protein [Atractiella rhizophila]